MEPYQSLKGNCWKPIGFVLLVILTWMPGLQAETRLTNNSVQEVAPSWNPAGDTIVYMRSAASSGSGVPYNLYQVQADGTGEGPFATGPASPWGVANTPSWLGATGLLLTEERNTYHEYMSFDSSKAPFTRTLTDGDDAAFTRVLMTPGGGGGGWIAASRDGARVMWRYSSSGGGGTQQVRSAAFSALSGQNSNTVGSLALQTSHSTQQRLMEQAAMTPDGSKFVIAMPEAGVNGDFSQPWDLWLHNTDGSGSPLNITNSASGGIWNRVPDISPDGTQILFSRWSGVAGDTWDLYRMDLDGSNLVQITNTPDKGEFDPSWSPDATRVAYTINGDIYLTPLSITTVTVSATVDTHGSLDATTKQVAQGATASFTVTPDPGYETNTSVGGTCPGGTWNGATYTTGPVSVPCSLSFTHSLIGMSTEICSGVVGKIENRDFIDETKECTTQFHIGMGPEVSATGISDITLTSASVSLNSPLQIGEQSKLRIRTSTSGVGSLCQAHLGPLSSAEIRAYLLTDLATPVEGPVTALGSTDDLQVAGRFGLDLSGIADDQWVLVSASGGYDIDPDDDGVADIPSTQNKGTLYALARASEWRSGKVQVTALTDLVWRFTRFLVGLVSPDELQTRLNELAQALVLQDINGDAQIDYQDLNAFVPRSSTHWSKLNFDYQILLDPDADGNSLVGAHHQGDNALVDRLLEQLFGHTLVLNPAKDDRYEKISVKAVVFGHGRVVSDIGGIVNDSEVDPSTNTPKAWLARNPTNHLVLSATPIGTTEVLGWVGCDMVSSDLSQCTIALDRNHQVIAKFGYKQTQLNGAVHDLSGATVVIDPTSLRVSILQSHTELINSLQQLQVGDYVAVPNTSGGLLRKVTAFVRSNSTTYQLTTEDATLGEVIAQGTGGLSTQLTNGDLRGYVAPASANQSATMDYSGFSALPGVRLIPSDDPNDTSFRLEFGMPAAESNEPMITQGLAVVLWSSDSNKLSVQGVADIKFKLDHDVSWGLLEGLEDFSFILTQTSALDMKFIYEGQTRRKAEAKVKVATIPIGQLVFFVGPVPVWVVPEIDIYLGADFELKATLTTGIKTHNNLRAGVVYKKGVKGWNYIYEPPFFSWDFINPDLSVEGIIRGFLEAGLQFAIYSAAGPVLGGETYLMLHGSLAVLNESIVTGQGCKDGLEASLKAGAAAFLKWELDDELRKFLGSLGLDDLESFPSFRLDLLKNEWLLKHWYLIGECAADPPFLEIMGDDIAEVMDSTNRISVQRSYSLKNVGGAKLPWNVTYSDDAAISVSPTSGQLDRDESAYVVVEVDTEKLELGTYRNKLEFKNTFRAPEKMTYDPLGSGNRYVEIKVQPPLDTAPVIASVDDMGSGKARIIWSFDAQSAPVEILGYEIEIQVSGNWAKLATVANANATAIIQSNLPTAELICFRIQAYADNGIRTPYSAPHCVTLSAGKLIIDPASGTQVSESGAVDLTLRREGDSTQAAVVNLSSSDTSEATTPATVTLGANVTSTQFSVSGVADGQVDGDQPVSLTAYLAGWETASASLSVTDEDGARLTLTLANPFINENGGSTTATVSRDGDLTNALTIDLVSNDTSEATTPAKISLPAGQSSADFSVTAQNDTLTDGYQIVVITASAADYNDASATLTVIDDEGPDYSYTKLNWEGGVLPDSATSWQCVRDNVTGLTWEAKDTSYDLHHHSSKYTWYDGQTGVQGVKSCSFGECNCYLDGNKCNTYLFVQQVNQFVNTFNDTRGRCNYTDWRLPTVQELMTLIDPSQPGSAIDGDYFPYVHEFWWTGTHQLPPNPTTPVDKRWYVYFRYGTWNTEHYSNYNQVMLVRDGR